MTETVLHPRPRPRDVARAQLRAVGLALRPAPWLIAVLAVGGLLFAVQLLREGAPVDFAPQRLLLPGIAGLLLPFALWKGEERFGNGFLWTLPVDRRGHALARAWAGWAWLMGGVLLLVLALLGLALLSGGNVLGQETVRLLPASNLFPSPGALEPGAWETVRRRPDPVLWLVPFTAATATYLLASALALGTRHPLRWIAGTLLAVFLLVGVAEATGSMWLLNEPPRVIRGVLLGPYGLDTVLSARTEFLRVGTTLTTGEQVVVWRGLPERGPWAAATLLWSCAGLLALWAAASRHRERRPP